jgi:hypothetical protein
MAKAFGSVRTMGIVAAVSTIALVGVFELNEGDHAGAAVCQSSAVPSTCVVGSGAGLSASQSATASARPSPLGVLLASQATMIAQVAGIPSNEPAAAQVNDTARLYQVDAADLGIVWDGGNGKVLIAFGDSYGNHWTAKPTGGPADTVGATADWRCNTLAVSSDHHLTDGLRIDTMIQDRAGHAGQILGCAKQPGSETTVIPTSAIHVGNADYLSYMSVRQWQNEWSWQTNYSGVAVSYDGGRTWTKTSATWPNNTGYSDPFQMTAFAQYGGYVYRFGTPNGRAGNAYLSRVPPGDLLNPASYQYWTGRAWEAGRDTLAVPVASGPIGELSVEYDASIRKWLMVSVDQTLDAITLRTADAPAGPWSAGQVLVKGSDYPGLYGGFIHPWSSGSDLYLTVSMWGPYQVYLMHSTLTVE